MLTAASAKHAASVRAENQVVAPINCPVVVNHLFVRRKPGSGGRNRTIAGAPQIAPMYACSGVVNAQLGVKTRAIARAKSLLEAQRRNPGQNAAVMRSDTTTQNDRVTRTHQRKDSTDSEVSNTSSVCGRSSTSSGSTVCAADSESEVSLSVAKSESDSSADGGEVKDLIWLTDAVDGDTGGVVTESQKSDSENGEQVISDDTDVGDSVADIGDRRESCEGAEAEDVIEFKETEDVDKLSQDRHDAKTDDKLFDDKHLCHDDLSHGDETGQPGNTTRGSHTTHSNTRQTQNNTSCNSPLKQDKLDLRYGAANIDCHPTLLQLASGWTPPPGDSTADAPPEGAHLTTCGNGQLSRSHISGATSPVTERIFNPFPSVHVSQRRTRNAVRLGLYSTENTPKLETGIVMGSGVKQIGRAQINACLHHHYMADIRQKARKTKRWWPPSTTGLVSRDCLTNILLREILFFKASLDFAP